MSKEVLEKEKRKARPRNFSIYDDFYNDLTAFVAEFPSEGNKSALITRVVTEYMENKRAERRKSKKEANDAVVNVALSKNGIADVLHSPSTLYELEYGLAKNLCATNASQFVELFIEAVWKPIHRGTQDIQIYNHQWQKYNRFQRSNADIKRLRNLADHLGFGKVKLKEIHEAVIRLAINKDLNLSTRQNA